MYKSLDVTRGRHSLLRKKKNKTKTLAKDTDQNAIRSSDKRDISDLVLIINIVALHETCRSLQNISEYIVSFPRSTTPGGGVDFVFYKRIQGCIISYS